MQIVAPSINDLPQLVDKVILFLKEDREEEYRNHFAVFSFNRAKLVSFIIKNLHSPAYFIRVVKTEKDEIIGGMVGYITSPVFSDDMIAKELILYFDPDNANLSAVFQLIEAFVEWAEKNEVKEVQIANSTGFKPEKFALLMKRKGLVPFETGYMRRT